MEGFKPEQNAIEVTAENIAQLRAHLHEQQVDVSDHESVLQTATEYFGEGYTTEAIEEIVRRYYADEERADAEADNSPQTEQ